MEQSTNQLTIKYIKEHPYIKTCLRKGLLNYSSLARLIGKTLAIENKTSTDAILVAARRYRDQLRNEQGYEPQIREILSKSELELKTKINVFIIGKTLPTDSLDELQNSIRKDSGTIYLLEGSASYTVIVQEKYSATIQKKLKQSIIQHEKDLVLINVKSPVEIETTPGVVAFLTSLFAENGVNIVQFLSCWRDTMFVIESKDLFKAMEFLRF